MTIVEINWQKHTTVGENIPNWKYNNVRQCGQV